MTNFCKSFLRLKKEKPMTNFRKSLIGLCVATISLGAMAQSADEHNKHHPTKANPEVAAAQMYPAGPIGSDMKGAMEQHMKAMQVMHEKMATAKTKEERQALMAEHMKLMQDGMAMMKSMDCQAGMGGMPAGKAKNASMAECQQMMEMRMNMMESMMQMMMDCMPAAPTK